MAVQFNKLKTFITFFFVLYFAVVITKGCIHNNKVLDRYSARLQEYEKELELNRELKQKLSAINNDQFIELIARKKLGLIKTGEIAYKIVEE